MKILNKLTLKHLKLNKKRTIVTIIGIILSTALMVGIGLLFSSMQDYSLYEVKEYNGNYHASMTNITYSDYNKIKNNNDITYFFEQTIGFAKIDSQNKDKPYIYIANVNDNYFKELELLEGRFPTSDNELVISKHIIDNAKVDYKVGDTITLDVGNRVYDNKILNNIEYQEDEQLINLSKKEYKIVGIVKRSIYEGYSSAGYSAFTTNSNIDSNINLYMIVNGNKNIIDKVENVAKDINYNIDNISYNNTLLMLYGESKYNNIQDSIVYALAIILGLISIGCIIVIYNSFAISVMERKKEFGLFSSIGTTKYQILYTILYEALFVGVIGIVLGILSSMLGIKIVLEIINYLLVDILDYKLKLVIIPLYIIIPIIFMIITIFISSIIPAIRASRVSPIEAIRQNDDIKINKKKIKTNKIITKIFGVEGEIALKNIKRNKKKYRITVISLIVSIVLFISFSAYLGYAINTSEDMLGTIDYDIAFSLYDNKLKENSMVKELLEDSSIAKKVEYKISNISVLNNKSNYNKDYLDIQKDRLGNTYQEYIDKGYTDVNIISLDNDSYKEYLKALGLNEDKIIVYNSYSTITYKNNNRKLVNTKVYQDNFTIKACKLNDIVDNLDKDYINKNCIYNINNIYVTNKLYFGIDLINNIEGIKLIVSDDMFKYLYNNYHTIYDEYDNYDNLSINYSIKASDTTNLDKIGEKLMENDNVGYYNIAKEMQLENNMVLVVKILMYGFISLIVLIGVTSVFNTINTSIALRRREFAILRSVGLTNKGFNKMLYFESLFLGLKSLLYGLPISFAINYLIHRSLLGIQDSSMYIPYNSYLIAIIAVFIIVLVTMMYSSFKIKKDNIIDQIRQENI